MHNLDNHLLGFLVGKCLEGFGLTLADLDEKEKDWLVAEALADLKSRLNQLIDDSQTKKGK